MNCLRKATARRCTHAQTHVIVRRTYPHTRTYSRFSRRGSVCVFPPVCPQAPALECCHAGRTGLAGPHVYTHKAAGILLALYYG